MSLRKGQRAGRAGDAGPAMQGCIPNAQARCGEFGDDSPLALNPPPLLQGETGPEIISPFYR